MNTDSTNYSANEILQENALLINEVRAARKASDITAELVVQQFVEIERILQALEVSRSRFSELYQESKKREQLYESLLHSTPDAVALYDLNGAVTYINPAFTSIFGFTLEDICGMHIPLVAKDLEDQSEFIFQQILAGKPISRWETLRPTKAGSVLNVALSASCYYDHEGNPSGVLTLLRDITDRKNAEQLLKKERETLFNILDRAPVGVALLDSAGNSLFFNSELTKLTGYTEKEIPSLEEWFVRAYPDPVYRGLVVAEWIEGPSAERTKKKRVYEVTCRDGETKKVEFRRTILEDGRMIVMLADVTEQQLREEKILQAKEQWERTFNAIDEVVTIQDLDMRVLRANRTARAYLGEHDLEINSLYCYELFSRASECSHSCPGILTLQDRSTHSAEIEMPHLAKTFLVTTSPIFDDNGQLSGFVHAAKDVTEQRKMEAELSKAQKLESIGLLAGGIAHDFNNILAAIVGNISLAQLSTEGNAKAQESLAQAERACMRAKEITYQLLTYSKGGTPIKKTTSIGGVVEESCKFALHGSNVKCEFLEISKPWPMDVDEGQISQVINNIVINAKQAMPEGGTITILFENVVIGLEHESRLPPGRYVKISIRDQGCGIPKEDLPRIFDPYFTTKESGSGLGLATSYSIVTKHEGGISASSEPGEGTTFKIFLPACETAVVESLEGLSKPVCGKGRVLLIDDEMMILDVTSELLRSLGYEVEAAQEGTVALKLYQAAAALNAPYDIVIIDLTIPGGMGGKTIVKKLHEIDPTVRAIASSGYSNDPVMSNYKEYGFCGVIPKPYRMHTLSEILRRVLCETAR